jgi:hypothetical protein
MLRAAAIALLLLAAAQVYACDISDACLTSPTTQTSDCDQPGGDNCLCCCHHVIPVIVLALDPGEIVFQEAAADWVVPPVAPSLPIDHPPQL